MVDSDFWQALDNLVVTLDYFRIDLEDRIAIGPSQVLTQADRDALAALFAAEAPYDILISAATGFEKIAWLLAMICLSWFAWVFYFFLAPIKPKRRYSRYDDDYFYDYR